MKIDAPKRIIADDFKKENQELASQFGDLINGFLDDIYQAMSKKLNIQDNLNQEIKIIKFKVADASGTLTTKVGFDNNLSGKVSGILPIRFFGDNIPLSLPIIEFVENNGIINITKIKGLSLDTEYQVSILIIGN